MESLPSWGPPLPVSVPAECVQPKDRNDKGDIDSTLIVLEQQDNGQQWNIKLPNGVYEVTVYIRDDIRVTDVSGCTIEDEPLNINAVDKGITAHVKVVAAVNDGQLTFKANHFDHLDNENEHDASPSKCESVNRIVIERMSYDPAPIVQFSDITQDHLEEFKAMFSVMHDEDYRRRLHDYTLDDLHSYGDGKDRTGADAQLADDETVVRRLSSQGHKIVRKLGEITPKERCVHSIAFVTVDAVMMASGLPSLVTRGIKQVVKRRAAKELFPLVEKMFIDAKRAPLPRGQMKGSKSCRSTRI